MSQYIQHTIEEQDFIGSVSGVLLESSEELDNALNRQKILFDDNLRQILSESLPIAFLKNMYVEDEFKNQGYGAELVGLFIDESSGLNANAIILESDEAESNNFDLTLWYESFGFEKLKSQDANPIMIRRHEENKNVH